MAFNPFHGFRKYSKVIFAALAIVCMFTFVASSGIGQGNDALDWISKQFGGRGRTQPVALLDGQTVSGQDLEEIRVLRLMASEYAQGAVVAAGGQVVKQVEDNLNKLDPDVQFRLQAVRQLVQARRAAFTDPNGIHPISQFIGSPMTNLDYYQRFVLRGAAQSIEQAKAQLNPLQKELGQLDEKTGNVTNDLNTLETVLQAELPGGKYFFGGSDDGDDLVDFMLWLKEADRRGIRFTDDDIKAEFAALCFNVRITEDAAKIEKNVAKHFQGYTPARLMQAMGNEFRVRAVQAALAGAWLSDRTHAPRTLTTPPAAVTPHEFFKYCQDNRSTIKVALLPVDARKLTGTVTDAPTPAELKELYDKYALLEPDPGRETPGFKQPREIKVAWVSGKPDLPYYREQGAKLLALERAVRLFAGLGGEGIGRVTAAAQVATPLTFDPLLGKGYEDYRERQARDKIWTSAYITSLSDTSVFNPEALTSVVGMLSGNLGLGNGVTSAAAAVGLPTQAMIRELSDRARVGSTSFLAALGNYGPFPTLGLPLATVPRDLPAAALRGQLTEKAVADRAKQVFAKDMETLQKEIATRGRGKDRVAAVKAYVDEFAKPRGLEVGTSTELRDQYHLIDDPGLAPLKEAYVQRSGKSDPLYQEFGPTLLALPPGARSGTTSLCQPKWFPSDSAAPTPRQPDDERAFLFWRIEDKDARKLTYEEAYPRVVEAWKSQKARERAKAEADKLATAARATKGDLRELRDLAAKNQVSLVELGPMAKLMPRQASPERFQATRRDYEPYNLPIEKVPYPTTEFMEKLFGLKDQAVGSTEVLPDRPKDVYYVTVLVEKDEFNLKDFDALFRASQPSNRFGDTLFEDLQLYQRRLYLQQILQQLRTDAKLKKEPDLAKFNRGRGDSDE